MDFGLGYLWVSSRGVGFGLDQRWVNGGGLCILVWIGKVGLLWFEQRFCGFAVV